MSLQPNFPDMPTVVGAYGAFEPLAPRTNLFAHATVFTAQSVQEPCSVVLLCQSPSGAFLELIKHQIHAGQPAPPQVFDWLPEVYALIEQGDDESAADIVVDVVDELLSASDFSRCDELLQMVDVKRLNPNLLITFLAVSLPAKQKLPSRSQLLRRTETRLAELEPERVDALLRTLR